ncbi:DUF1178 family protein [Ideonella sp. 4Y16]|uniref:DUF1178 family protein n=1 Tax=Ideonella alba TaxID=2824118 RepID=A0A940YK70_9BURK|nr:DUF1178 family protein [Ideonella alba]MBQ0931349.1 DUF1178 family protein [Ideonella alba]MBQ0945063.1 DUF1178 family protein [Ideonella alba]
MKVLNLRCEHEHGFEGWFASEDDYRDQLDRGLLSCPLCASAAITRLPSAPRLNISGAQPSPTAEPRPPAEPARSAQPELAAQLQSALQAVVQDLMQRTEDVGPRFPEEARRIHYGETEARGIRGQATPQEREALRDEGIEVFALPLPPGSGGPTH